MSLNYIVTSKRLWNIYRWIRPTANILWSMRFEANHQYFKQLSRRVRNFRNITGTLSERYQRKKCCEQAGHNCPGSLVSFPETNKRLLVKSFPPSLQNGLLSKFGIANDVQCVSVSWLQIEGLKLFVNGYLILDVPDNQMPSCTLIILYISWDYGLCAESWHYQSASYLIIMPMNWMWQLSGLLLHQVKPWTAIPLSHHTYYGTIPK